MRCFRKSLTVLPSYPCRKRQSPVPARPYDLSKSIAKSDGCCAGNDEGGYDMFCRRTRFIETLYMDVSKVLIQHN